MLLSVRPHAYSESQVKILATSKEWRIKFVSKKKAIWTSHAGCKRFLFLIIYNDDRPFVGGQLEKLRKAKQDWNDPMRKFEEDQVSQLPSFAVFALSRSDVKGSFLLLWHAVTMIVIYHRVNLGMGHTIYIHVHPFTIIGSMTYLRPFISVYHVWPPHRVHLSVHFYIFGKVVLKRHASTIRFIRFAASSGDCPGAPKDEGRGKAEVPTSAVAESIRHLAALGHIYLR